jgi:hypothetical protein
MTLCDAEIDTPPDGPADLDRRRGPFSPAAGPAAHRGLAVAVTETPLPH